jgi:hypothetical protein
MCTTVSKDKTLLTLVARSRLALLFEARPALSHADGVCRSSFKPQTHAKPREKLGRRTVDPRRRKTRDRVAVEILI